MTLVCLHALCLSSESSKFFKCSLRSMSLIDLIIGCWIEAHPSPNRISIVLNESFERYIRIDLMVYLFTLLLIGLFTLTSIGTLFTLLLIGTFYRVTHTLIDRDFLIGLLTLTLIGTFHRVTHTHIDRDFLIGLLTLISTRFTSLHFYSIHSHHFDRDNHFHTNSIQFTSIGSIGSTHFHSLL